MTALATPPAAAAAAPDTTDTTTTIAAAADTQQQQQQQPLPNPVFEGSEKRVEIDFDYSAAAPARGLRALTRGQLDELMSLAACTIVSRRTNGALDAYVLSESSLFVYPTKWVLKTCGTTKLLNAVPRLLEMAAALSMAPRRCKYSRASFLFPEQQPFPHTSFEHEAFFLRRHFGHLGPTGGSAYVLGDMFNGLQWHVYVADAAGAAYEDALHPLARPTHKLEVCMTGLGKAEARQFFRDPVKPLPAPAVTLATGIRALVPSADVDDYVFEPCGYSMNGIAGPGFITIHVTPEEGCSYASVELAGFDAAAYDPCDMVGRILAIFRPATASVSLSVDVASASGEYQWGALAARPAGYGCASATCQELAAGGRVSYYTLSPLPAADGAAAAKAAAKAADGAKGAAAAAASGHPHYHFGPKAAAALKAAAAAAAARAATEAAAEAAAGDADAPLRPVSPATVLRHMPSFSTLPSDGSSSTDLDAGSSGDEQQQHQQQQPHHEAGARLAAALRRLRRGRSRSGSTSPKSAVAAAVAAAAAAAGAVPVPAAPPCAACKGSGVACGARGAAAGAPAGSTAPASPQSPVRLEG